MLNLAPSHSHTLSLIHTHTHPFTLIPSFPSSRHLLSPFSLALSPHPPSLLLLPPLPPGLTHKGENKQVLTWQPGTHCPPSWPLLAHVLLWTRLDTIHHYIANTERLDCIAMATRRAAPSQQKTNKISASSFVLGRALLRNYPVTTSN